MKIKIVTVGKLKETYLKNGIAEYFKRLTRFCKMEMIELADEKIPDKSKKAEQEQILEKEGNRILSKINEREFVIALAIEGRQLSSEEFSTFLDDVAVKGFSTITFIIGGSLGLATTVKKRANLLISFGKMTLPHQLMRLVLVEQIYRSFMIREGSLYHK